MKLSARSRYGLRAAVELAIRWGEGPVQIKVVSERENISIKYLEQLLTQLKSADLVHSMRGARGGYYLSRDAKEITLYDIIKVLEGPLEPVECISGLDICGDCTECAVKDIWLHMSDVVKTELQKFRLDEIAATTLKLREANEKKKKNE